MAKPAKWDSMTPSEQEAWRVKAREKRREYDRKCYEANCDKIKESNREYYKANCEKVRESVRKAAKKAKNQSAADQFFIMAGAAEQLTKLKPKQ